MSPEPRHILIAGPTASGKSAMALALARAGGGVIVNADALQVYGCWSVLTARPTPQDDAQAPHALYGHVDYRTPYSVGAWLREVTALKASGHRLIIVGGTGLYLSALTRGLADIPATPPEVRAEGDRLRTAKGKAAFIAYLDLHDPEVLRRMDQNNPMRLQRAWEVHKATGKPLSAWQRETPAPLIPLPTCDAFVLHSAPDWLNARIDQRFDIMMTSGALEEVRAMEPHWGPELPSAKALGAPELIAVLRDELPLDAATTKAKTATRQFAKRQRTWFRSNMKEWRWLDLQTDAVQEAIKGFVSGL